MWTTNNTSDGGVYKIKVTGSIHNQFTGLNFIGSLYFYLIVIPEIKYTNNDTEFA